MIQPTDFVIDAASILCRVDAAGEAQVETDVTLRVTDGRIVAIAPRSLAPAEWVALPRFGDGHTIVIPGLVNSHHHSGLTPLMLGVPFAPLELWLPQFRGMRGVGERLDTLYSAIEMLESGTTTVHHIHGGLTGTPDNWQRTADDVLGAYLEIGMRAGFSFMIRDQNQLAYEDDALVLGRLPSAVADWLRPRLAASMAPTDALMAFFLDLKRRWNGNADRLRFNLAPANLHWCSDETLQLISETARASGANLHMHLVETERQADYARQKFGHSAVAHLHALGCLGPELTLGHGNWMSRADLDLIADHQCSVCHNASSGLRLGSGIAPLNEIRRRGVKLALGIDQSNINDDRDMTQEMRLVWALHRETGMWNDRPTAAQVLQMATEHGARTAGFLEVGIIEVGRPADLVLLDKRKIARPFIDPRIPLAEAILHRGGKQAIDKVFAGGVLVVDGGKVISIDRDAVLAEIGERLNRPPTEAEREAQAMVDAMMPSFEAYHREVTPSAGYRSYRYNAMGEA